MIDDNSFKSKYFKILLTVNNTCRLNHKYHILSNFFSSFKKLKFFLYIEACNIKKV